MQVQGPLLALLSPLLASLLAQVHEPRPCLSLPCTSSQLRSLLRCLVLGQEVDGRGEQELAAVLGIGRVGGSKQVKLSMEEVAEDKDKVKHSPQLEIKQTHGYHISKEKLSTIGKDKQTLQEENKGGISTLPDSIDVDVIVENSSEFLEDCMKDAIKEYVCATCESTFDTRRRLKDHKHFEHKTEPVLACQTLDTLICDICSKTFSNKYLLKYHIPTHDTGSEDTNCNICSKTFSNKYILKTHMHTHDPDYINKRHICSECSRSFSTKAVLKKHIMGEHSDEKFTPCSICGLAFKSFSISKHISLCKLPENKREEIKEKRKVECFDCGKVIADKVKLRRHKRFIHNKEKLFKCKYCDHKDFRPDNMKMHIKNKHPKSNPNESFSRIIPSVEVVSSS